MGGVVPGWPARSNMMQGSRRQGQDWYGTEMGGPWLGYPKISCMDSHTGVGFPQLVAFIDVCDIQPCPACQVSPSRRAWLLSPSGTWLRGNDEVSDEQVSGNRQAVGTLEYRQRHSAGGSIYNPEHWRSNRP